MTDPQTLVELRRWHEQAQGTPALEAAERARATMKPGSFEALRRQYPVKAATDEERDLATLFALAAIGPERLEKMALVVANVKPGDLVPVSHVDVQAQDEP